MSKQESKQAGFTFLEIAGVMAVSGVLAAMGLPMVQQFQSQSAVSGAQNSFAESLAQARTFAVSQGTTVRVCGSVDGKACASNAWSEGWLVYSSDQSAVEGQVIAPENIVSHYQLGDSHYNVQVFDEQWQAVNEIRFDTQGFNLAQQRLAATVCLPGKHAQVDAVLVERTGRVRLSNNASDKAATQAVINNAQSSTFSQCNQA